MSSENKEQPSPEYDFSEVEEALANIMAQYPAVFKHFFQAEIEKIRTRKA